MELKPCPSPKCEGTEADLTSGGNWAGCERCGLQVLIDGPAGVDHSKIARDQWNALPRASGGLEGAVKQDISTVLDWIEVEEGHGGDAHDENCNICRAMERLRALPDSSGVERLKTALRSAETELKLFEDDAVCDHSANICWCQYWNCRELITQALAGTKP